MVRHKSRWLLIRVDNEEEVKALTGSRTSQYASIIEKKTLYHAIRIQIEESFGISASGIADGIQCRLYQSDARIAMLKVPREHCSRIRAAITLLTRVGDEPITAVVVSISGSARTAKLAALREIKQRFHQMNSNESLIKKNLKRLDQNIEQICGFD